MRRICALLTIVFSVLSMSAQMVDPVHFTSQLKELPNNEAEIIFRLSSQERLMPDGMSTPQI